LISSDLLHAQITDFEPEYYYKQSLSIQKTGMIVLSSWAGLNLLSGIAGNFRYQSESKYFFQMNAAWNVVNLGIAAFGFAGVANAVLDVDSSYMLSELKKFDRILLINAGLDVIYVATGALLLNKGLKNNRARFIGYGRSILLQGGFLFLFDMILYLTHRPYTKSLFQITEKINITTTGLSIAF
jgi:hypothetical protein